MKVEKAIAKDVTYFVVTCDGWSSRANHSYTAVILTQTGKYVTIC